MRKKLIIAVLVACLLVSSGVAAAIVRGHPELHATLPNNQVAPGQDAQLSVQISNSGVVDNESMGTTPAEEQMVTTAKAVRVSLQGKGPIQVKSGAISLGSLQDGMVRTADAAISVDKNAKPGTYRLPVKLHYDYTYQYSSKDGVHSDLSESKTAYVTVTVKDAPRFEVVGANTTTSVGDTGDVALTLQNVGSAAAYGSQVTVQSTSPQFAVGSSGAVSRYTGDWQPGENRTVVVSAAAATTANTAPYTFTSIVNYQNENGQARQSDPVSTGVAPEREQSFGVSNVQSSLRVGENGNLTGTVTNNGPNDASHVVVHVAANAQGVVPKRTEYAVGTLASGDSTDVNFPVEVSTDAESGPQQVSFDVTYQNAAGDTRKSDALPARVDIAQKRNAFVIQPTDVNVTAGGSGTVTLQVTNNMDRTVSNVNAKIFANSPLSANDDSAFATSLAPGESTAMTFDVGASGSAIAKNYPLRMDFQYENAKGEQKLSDTYQVPVTVVVPEGGGLPVVPIGVSVVVLGLLAGGYYYWTRN